MSNYLNQLVAKNLNLVDTVQPLLLSIFGFLPEPPSEMKSEENWGINQEMILGDSRDSAIATQLEKSPRDIVQPLELQAIAQPTSSFSQTLPQTTNLNQSQISSDISFTPGLTDNWEQALTVTSDLKELGKHREQGAKDISILSEQTSFIGSYLVDKSDAESVFEKFFAATLSTFRSPLTPLFKGGTGIKVSLGKGDLEGSKTFDTDKRTFQTSSEPYSSNQISPIAANTQLFSDFSDNFASEQLTQKQLEIPQTQVFTPSTEPKGITAQLNPDQSQPQSAPITPVTQQVINAMAVKQPTTALDKKPQEIDFPGTTEHQIIPEIVNTPTTSATANKQAVKSHSADSFPQSPQMSKSETNVPYVTYDKLLSISETPVKSHLQNVPFVSEQLGMESNRVVPSPPSSKVIAEELNQERSPQPQSIFKNSQTQQSTPAPAVEQSIQPAKESLGQQLVYPPQLQEIATSRTSPTTPEPKSEVIESTSNKLLLNIEKLPFSSSSNVDSITPLSDLAVKSHKKSVTLLSEQLEIESNRVVPSALSSKAIAEQLNQERSPQPVSLFVDTQTLENNTGLAQTTLKPFRPSPQEPLGQPGMESNRVVPSALSSKAIAEQLNQERSLQPVSFFNQAQTQQSTPAPAVESSIQPARESLGQQAVKIYPSDSPFLPQKLSSSEQSPNQLKPEPVSLEQPSSVLQNRQLLRTPNLLPNFSPNQENLSPLSLETVNSTPNLDEKGTGGLNFPLAFPDEIRTQNLLQPRNDDSRRDSVFVSANRQEPQQRESFSQPKTPPTIKVSIGSMEIRTPPPPPRPKPRPKPPVMSLDEYLRQRSRGR